MASTRKPAVRRSKTPGSLKASRPVVAKEPRSLVEIVSTPEDPEDEGIPVFSIDGVLYCMPSMVESSLALEMLDQVRHTDEMSATAWMLEQVLGTEAYQALKSARGMKPEQLNAIIDHVVDHAMGGLEGMGKG
jgi:hypothetical protein